MESISKSSGSDVILTKKGDGDYDVIVIDDTPQPAATSAHAVRNRNMSSSSASAPVKMKKIGQLSSAVSLLPLRCNLSLPTHGPATSNQISWQPLRLMVRGESKSSSTSASTTQSPVLLATQLLTTSSLGVQVKENHWTVVSQNLDGRILSQDKMVNQGDDAALQNPVSLLKAKEYQLPPTSLCSTVPPSGSPVISSVPASINVGPTSDATNRHSETIVLVLPSNLQHSESSCLIQPKSQNFKVQSLFKTSSTSQTKDVGSKAQNFNKIYLLQKGKNISQLQKMELSTADSGLSSCDTLAPRKEKVRNLTTGNQSQMASSSVINTASQLAPVTHSALSALIKLANKTSRQSVSTSPTNTNLQLVTVSKDGIVAPAVIPAINHSGVKSVIDQTKQNVLQHMGMSRKKINETVTHSGKLQIGSRSCPFSVTPSHQENTTLLKNNVTKRSNPRENIILQGDSTPLCGHVQNCSAEKTKLSSITLKKLSGSSASSVSAEKITQAISSLTQYLTVSGNQVSSNCNRDFLLKVDDQHVLVMIPQDFLSNQGQATLTTSLLPPAKPVTMQPKPTTIVNTALRSFLMKQESSVRTILPQNTATPLAKKEELKKAGKQATRMKDAVVRVKNNGKVQPDIMNENIYFTTLKTRNSQIAMKVVQPNFDDDANVNNQLTISSVSTTKMNVGQNDVSIIEDTIENVLSKSQISHFSDISPFNEHQLDQARIQKSAKLEKIVENILRSHKADENTVHTQLFWNEDTVSNNSNHKILSKKSASLENSLSDCKDNQDIVNEATGFENDSECDLNIKIASVFSLNPESAMSQEMSEQSVNVDTEQFTSYYQESDETVDQSEDVDKENISYNYKDDSSWTKYITPCYVVLERLSRSSSTVANWTLSSPSVAKWIQSQCSEYCRKRTLDYMCHYKLIKCELDQESGGEYLDDLGKNQTPTNGNKSLTLYAGSNPECLPAQTKTDNTDACLPAQTKTDNTDACKLCVNVTTEISNEAMKTTNISRNAVYIKPFTNEMKTDSQLLYHLADQPELFEPSTNAINTFSFNPKEDIESNTNQVNTLGIDSTENNNDLRTSLQNLDGVSFKSSLKVVKVKIPSQPAVEKSTALEIPGPYSVVTYPSSQSHASLLKPRKTPETKDTIYPPEKSFSNKNIETKEFHIMLTELKSQVERKREDMKKIHVSRMKKKNSLLCIKRKSDHYNKKIAIEKVMTKKLAGSPVEREKLACPFVLPSADKTKASSMRPLASKPFVVSSSQSLPSSSLTAGGPSSQIPVEKIKAAMSSLTKYLLATGTKVTSDNNKYFLLKIDDKHVLVKIPQDFPLNQNITTVATSVVPSTKLIPIQPKPAASSLSFGLKSQLMKQPSPVTTILPQSQRSATLMARINRNRPGDQTCSEQTQPTMVQESNLKKTLDSLHNPHLAIKIDLAHLPLTASLLPQKRKVNTKLTNEDKRAKRARLEVKYPLPPGVIIKSEPDDQNVYQIDDNWAVTSEFLTTIPTSSPSASSEVEMSREHRSGNTEGKLNRNCVSNRCDKFMDDQLTVTDVDGPPALYVTPSTQDDASLIDDEDETPPLLQPMLPCLVSKYPDDQTHLTELSADTPVSSVLSQASLLSYVSDCSQSTERQRPAYKNSKIERLKELLKKKELEIEALRKNRR
ncbi:hypothetical protein Btru_002807 [Bulinus truncatus]|nr:hypothetical protein Btru_002807 [Bulinus truncatus]